MTPRQQAYITSRRQGLGQGQAARAAGYSPATAAAAASRLERMPAIKAAIAQARQSAPGSPLVAIADCGAPAGATGTPEFEDAESYLLGVIQGVTVADPVRVSAARTLIAYQQPRRRAPVKSATPRQMNEREALSAEEALLSNWAETAARVRERLARERAKRP